MCRDGFSLISLLDIGDGWTSDTIMTHDILSGGGVSTTHLLNKPDVFLKSSSNEGLSGES